MNDVLNFKSITTYRVALPLKFEFKTAKGTVRVRESIIVRIEDQQGYVGYGECVAFTDPFYTAETVDSAWKQLVDTYSRVALNAAKTINGLYSAVTILVKARQYAHDDSRP